MCSLTCEWERSNLQSRGIEAINVLCFQTVQVREKIQSEN